MKPDNFKAINDTYGHEAGDLALVAIGSALTQYLLETSLHDGPKKVILVRYTGNELSFIFPDTGKNEAREIARGLRSFLNSLDLSAITQGEAQSAEAASAEAVSAEERPPFRLSVSIGIAVFPEYATSSADLIKLARELPLIGRERGGNMILFPEDK